MRAARPAATRHPLVRVQAGREPPASPATPPRGPARLLPLISAFLCPDCPWPPQQIKDPVSSPACSSPSKTAPLWSARATPCQVRSACLALPGEGWGSLDVVSNQSQAPGVGGGCGEVALPSLWGQLPLPPQGDGNPTPWFKELLRAPRGPHLPSSPPRPPGEQVHLENQPLRPGAPGQRNHPAQQAVCPAQSRPQPLDPLPREHGSGNATGIILLIHAAQAVMVLHLFLQLGAGLLTRYHVRCTHTGVRNTNKME